MSPSRLDNYAVADAPRLGVRGWARWVWRQVTSMRLALVLLLLVGLAAIPGSLLPQRPQSPGQVTRFLTDNPQLGPVLDAAGFLDVFNSAWFTAIYVLLVLSLVGCIVPRTFHYARAMRAPVAPVPRSLARYSPQVSVPVTDAQGALEAIAGRLRQGFVPYRVRIEQRSTSRGVPQWALSAEHNYVREAGNLLFHIGIVALIVVFAVGSFISYRGQAVVVEGRSFVNAVAGYDAFEPGRAFNPEWLPPFTIGLTALEAEFSPSGAPADFTAAVSGLAVDGTVVEDLIKVNAPLSIDGAQIFLAGNGYAPALTIRDGAGEIAFSGAVPFLPQDAAYTSDGVIKVPDVSLGEQLGIRATLLPTAAVVNTVPISLYPQPTNPVIVFQVFVGDLGLDDGVPQNVYVLQTDAMEPIREDSGEITTFFISPGETVTLPDGRGNVTWDALPRFAAFDVRADPTLGWLLAAAIITMVGIAITLLGTQRKIWATASGDEEVTLVIAAYSPHFDGALKDMCEVLARVGKGDS